MTDALAAWFVREQEKTPLAALHIRLRAALSSAETFAAWLHELRAAGQIKNDDTTVIWIYVDENRIKIGWHQFTRRGRGWGWMHCSFGRRVPTGS